MQPEIRAQQALPLPAWVPACADGARQQPSLCLHASLPPPRQAQLLHNWNQLHMRTAFEDFPVGICHAAQAYPSPLPAATLLRTLGADVRHPSPPPTPHAQEPAGRRHLLRLHLTHEEARPLDPAFYGDDPPGARLGVYAEGTVETVPLEAE